MLDTPPPWRPLPTSPPPTASLAIRLRARSLCPADAEPREDLDYAPSPDGPKRSPRPLVACSNLAGGATRILLNINTKHGRSGRLRAGEPPPDRDGNTTRRGGKRPERARRGSSAATGPMWVAAREVVHDVESLVPGDEQDAA